MKIALISDTHALLNKLEVPIADMVVHCGDFGFNGSVQEWKKFLEDYSKLPHKYKLFTFGNHDCSNENNISIIKQEALDKGIHLLVNEMIEIEGKKIFGSPYTPRYGSWYWMKNRGSAIAKIWNVIPEGLDLLYTHGPAHGILDISIYDKVHCGCEELMKAIIDKKPRFHAFGHIHYYGGRQQTEGDTTFINAAVVGEDYKIANPITVIEI